jgi:lantibiotic modifying enzyme
MDILDSLDLRILIRDTSTYTGLQLRLLHPEFLRDGLDRSIELEWLARPLSGTESPAKGRRLVYERERTAMELLDVPHFVTSEWRNTEDITDDDELMLLCGKRDSSVLQRRLANFSPAHCARQLSTIEEAVRSGVHNPPA